MAKVMDDGIGNVTNALKTAGIFEDTFIIFTADVGPAPPPVCPSDAAN